jgi:hypothetical protein
MGGTTTVKVYISGPMEGVVDLNFAAFYNAEEALREAGHQPINPARHGQGKTKAYYMRRAMHDVLAAEALAMLPGWLTSVGARFEKSMAEMLELQIEALDYYL